MADTPKDTPNLPDVPENVGTSLSDDTLRDVRSFEDAFAALKGIDVENVSDFGTGFAVLPTNEKNRLVGVPFVILEWRFSKGDNGHFVSCALVTKGNEKLILNDGSTGIRDQLVKITRARLANGRKEPQKGLLVEHGLSESRYTYTDTTTGEQRPAVTYYLAN